MMTRPTSTHVSTTNVRSTDSATDPITGASITPPGEWLGEGAWDCHVHVFDSKYAFSSERTFTPGEAPLTALRDMRQRLRMDHSVIVQPSVYGTDNSLLIHSLEQEEGRLRGVAVISPALADAGLQRMHEAGVRAVRLNLETFGLTDPQKAGEHLRELANKIRSYGWHIQVYSSLQMFMSLKHVLTTLPCPVVIDHFGGVNAAAGIDQPGFDGLLTLLAGGNVFLKLSAPSRISRLPSQEDIRPIVDELFKVRPDRLLWGSDWPHTGGLPGQIRQRDVIEPFAAIDDGANLNLLAHWIQNPKHRAALWQLNPASLYG